MEQKDYCVCIPHLREKKVPQVCKACTQIAVVRAVYDLLTCDFEQRRGFRRFYLRRGKLLGSTIQVFIAAGKTMLLNIATHPVSYLYIIYQWFSNFVIQSIIYSSLEPRATICKDFASQTQNI